MEQALEMEECGLYVGQPSVTIDTDNAISSSEATAALHFKIKSEFDPVDLSSTRIKEEDHGRIFFCDFYFCKFYFNLYFSFRYIERHESAAIMFIFRIFAIFFTSID